MNCSFIVPVNNEKQYEKLQKSLTDFKDYELIPIRGAKSFFDAWRQGLKKVTKKYICLTHQDTEYVGIPDLDKYFKDKVGMIGTAGTTVLHVDQPWWFSKERFMGGILSGQIFYPEGNENKLSPFGSFGEVVVLDGVCMITTKEILGRFFADTMYDEYKTYGLEKTEWTAYVDKIKKKYPQLMDKTYGAWDFYDHMLSLELIKRGYKLLTVPIVMTHASKGGDKRPSFFTDMDVFKEEYLKNKTWRI